jgi:hypothetical protein
MISVIYNYPPALRLPLPLDLISYFVRLIINLSSASQQEKEPPRADAKSKFLCPVAQSRSAPPPIFSRFDPPLLAAFSSLIVLVHQKKWGGGC